jgi:hypothetical protein
MDDILLEDTGASPMRRGKTMAILICRAPGCGKSTILGLAARAAVASGNRVAWVRPRWDSGPQQQRSVLDWYLDKLVDHVWAAIAAGPDDSTART